MKELYQRLYAAYSSYDHFHQAAHFISMKGTDYDKNSTKFLLIGRAPNGWESLNTQSSERFGTEAEKQFNTDRWAWIELVNGTQYSTHDKNLTNLKDRYCLDKKPFWYYSKAVWELLSKQAPTATIWQKNIAWTNLYKVSPKDSDNPDWQSQQIQQQVCIDILKKELETYQPSHVLIATGFDWFAPFASVFENVRDTGRRNVSRGKDKNKVYVEGTATYKTAKVIIVCRPEHRDKSAYLEEITEAFHNSFSK